MLLLMASVIWVCEAEIDMALASSSVMYVIPTKKDSWYPAGLFSSGLRMASPPTERSVCAILSRTSVALRRTTDESG